MMGLYFPKSAAPYLKLCSSNTEQGEVPSLCSLNPFSPPYIAHVVYFVYDALSSSLHHYLYLLCNIQLKHHF